MDTGVSSLNNLSGEIVSTCNKTDKFVRNAAVHQPGFNRIERRIVKSLISVAKVLNPCTKCSRNSNPQHKIGKEVCEVF